MTLLQKYGMLKSAQVIQGFYEDVGNDPLLSDLFESVSIADLASHQVDVLVSVMGGPRSYTRRQIQHAHRRLRIDDAQFEAMLDHLRRRLLSNGFDAADAERIVAAYRHYQGAVTRI